MTPFYVLIVLVRLIDIEYSPNRGKREAAQLGDRNKILLCDVSKTFWTRKSHFCETSIFQQVVEEPPPEEILYAVDYPKHR